MGLRWSSLDSGGLQMPLKERHDIVGHLGDPFGTVPVSMFRSIVNHELNGAPELFHFLS